MVVQIQFHENEKLLEILVGGSHLLIDLDQAEELRNELTITLTNPMRVIDHD